VLQPSFVPARTPGTGTRLYLLHTPVGRPASGAVVYVHPFAEEMNKSRRMAAMTSRALAAAGFAVLQVDLHGCGDSSGDFEDATWEGWVRDVRDACDWLAQQQSAPLWLWGLRAGALLARDAAEQMAQTPHLLFWQPLQQGRQQVQWMLRMLAAAHWADGGGKAQMEAARQALDAGRMVHAGGYALTAAMAACLQRACLQPLPVAGGVESGGRHLVWLETSATPAATVSPAAASAAQAWGRAGWETTLQCVVGPAFWHATEIEDAPALLEATVDALHRATTSPTSAEPAVAPQP
jgi:exosortase A-associated hydrolase 2